MDRYALEQGSTLLGRLAFRLGRAPRLHDPESVHDLRVAIRRFQQCLRVFHQFFPRGEAKRIRRRLRKVMNLSAEVRERDIALGLIKQSGAAADGRLGARLVQQRKKAQREGLIAAPKKKVLPGRGPGQRPAMGGAGPRPPGSF